MPSKHPQFNRRLPQRTLDAIKDLAASLGVSEADIVKLAVAAFWKAQMGTAQPQPGKLVVKRVGRGRSFKFDVGTLPKPPEGWKVVDPPKSQRKSKGAKSP